MAATAHLTSPAGEITYLCAVIFAPHWASFFCTMRISSAGGLPLTFTTPEMDPPPATGPPAYWAEATAAAASRMAVACIRFFISILRDWVEILSAGLEEHMQPPHKLILVHFRILGNPGVHPVIDSDLQVAGHEGFGAEGQAGAVVLGLGDFPIGPVGFVNRL